MRDVVIGVVIPVHNGAAYLGAAIASVRVQTRPDWRLIIVDDGSTDNGASLAVARAAAAEDDRIAILSQPNAGVAAARNAGLVWLQVHVGPDLVAVTLLDQDDVYEPDMLATLWPALCAHPEASAVYGLPREIDAAGCPVDYPGMPLSGAVRYLPDGPLHLRQLAEAGNEPHTTFDTLVYWPCIATPGQVLIRYTGPDAPLPRFDPDTVPSDDWDYWIALARCAPLVLVPQVVMAWRGHGGNTSGTLGSKLTGARVGVHEKWLRDPTLTRDERRAVVWGMFHAACLQARWAPGHWRQGRRGEAVKTVLRSGRELGRWAASVSMLRGSTLGLTAASEGAQAPGSGQRRGLGGASDHGADGVSESPTHALRDAPYRH